jgi:hypothetical protein
VVPKVPKGVHFQRAAGAVVWFSLPLAALPPKTVSRQKEGPFMGRLRANFG